MARYLVSVSAIFQNKALFWCSDFEIQSCVCKKNLPSVWDVASRLRLPDGYGAKKGGFSCGVCGRAARGKHRMTAALHVAFYLFSVLIVACGELMSVCNSGLIREGRGLNHRGAIPRGRLFLRSYVGGSLRLRGGFDAVPLHEFEALLDCLQRPDATPQQRQHAQQFALSLQNPVDLSEIPQQGDAASRRQAALTKRLSQLQHILDCSQSPTAQVRGRSVHVLRTECLRAGHVLTYLM
jgi:hypothetical protein